MNSIIEKTSKLIPFLSILILLSSIIKNYIYYFNFGININEYIELSEFPLLFINDFSFYFAFIISFLLFFPFVYIKIYVRDKLGSTIPFSFTKKFTKAALPSLIIVIIYNCLKDAPLDIKLSSIENFIVIFFAILLLYLDKDLTFSKNYYFIVSSILMLFFSALNSVSDIYKVENNKIKLYVSFEIDNEIISTNNEKIYLGKTKNYIYVYNKKLKETEVFNFEEVKNFKVKGYPYVKN